MIGQSLLLKLWNMIKSWSNECGHLARLLVDTRVYLGSIHNFRRAKFVYNRYLQFTTQLSAIQTQNIQTAAAENI